VKGVSGRIGPQRDTIDVGNPETILCRAARLEALGEGEISFTEVDQIKTRPFAPSRISFADLSAASRSRNVNGGAPATIRGPLRGGTTIIESSMSQYLSNPLFVTLLANGDSGILVSLFDDGATTKLPFVGWM